MKFELKSSPADFVFALIISMWNVSNRWEKKTKKSNLNTSRSRKFPVRFGNLCCEPFHFAWHTIRRDRKKSRHGKMIQICNKIIITSPLGCDSISKRVVSVLTVAVIAVGGEAFEIYVYVQNVSLHKLRAIWEWRGVKGLNKLRALRETSAIRDVNSWRHIFQIGAKLWNL